MKGQQCPNQLLLETPGHLRSKLWSMNNVRSSCAYWLWILRNTTVSVSLSVRSWIQFQKTRLHTALWTVVLEAIALPIGQFLKHSLCMSNENDLDFQNISQGTLLFPLRPHQMAEYVLTFFSKFWRSFYITPLLFWSSFLLDISRFFPFSQL